MSDTIEKRIEALQHAFPKKLPMTLAEVTKWYLMFAEKSGCGYATERDEYTPADWTWFEANKDNFVLTTREMQRRGKATY